MTTPEPKPPPEQRSVSNDMVIAYWDAYQQSTGTLRDAHRDGLRAVLDVIHRDYTLTPKAK